MELKNKRIVIGITSAFYAIEKVIPQIEKLINNGADIIPVMSFNCYNLDFKGFSKHRKAREKRTEEGSRRG